MSRQPKKKGSKDVRGQKWTRNRSGSDIVTGVCSNALSYAMAFYESCDTPRALALYLMCKHREYGALVSMKIDPLAYNCPGSFFVDYQCTKLLAKCIDIKTGIDTRRVATQAFLNAEIDCATTNHYFRCLWSGSFQFSRPVSSVLYLAQRKIADILGDVPDVADLDFGFGPGACLSVRKDTAIIKKLESALECTFALSQILPDFLMEFPGWIPPGTHDVNIVDGSELTYVPKNAKTDRPICIEPLLNGLFQKGVGSYLKNRLAREGVDLWDQTINQRLAACGVERNLATVDFASASDTISYNLVADLLPVEWFLFLDKGRSPNYVVEGDVYSFHKFSSMGNAYTFELESMIFYAIAWATLKHLGITPLPKRNLSVYGDDVILPVEAYGLFAEVASAVGFTVNSDKSFHNGMFRESCGTDVFDGYEVTPFKIESLKGRHNVYKTANQLLKIIERTLYVPDSSGHAFVRAARLWDLHSRVIASVPRSSRLLIPADQGDGGFHCPFDVARPTRANGKDGWRTRALKWEPEVAVFTDCPPGLPTWGRNGLSGHPDRVTPANRVVNPKYVWREVKSHADASSDPVAVPRWLKGEPYRSDKGTLCNAYTLRGRGRWTIVNSLIFGQWKDPGIPWSTRAARLVS